MTELTATRLINMAIPIDPENGIVKKASHTKTCSSARDATILRRDLANFKMNEDNNWQREFNRSGNEFNRATSEFPAPKARANGVT